MSSLIQAGEESSQNKKNSYTNKPGWAEYVDSLYDSSREVIHMWVNAGKPRQGPVYDLHVKSKPRFKYALRFIKNNENILRKEKLAELNPEAFWREIKTINNCNTPLPSSIEGVSGGKEIIDLWRKHLGDLLNCVNNGSVDVCEYDCDTPYDEIVVTVEEVTNAIKKLDVNKDGIIMFRTYKICRQGTCTLLSLCFTSLFAHGFLAESMLSVVLVPVIKDNADKIASKDNYHPIALASVFSKIIEVIILGRIEIFLNSNPNQFGLKRKHGTDQCIYVLKEIIDLYRTLNGSVFVCFLDASKAFDRVNHRTLFKNLSERGVYTTNILIYWYHNQTTCIRWCDVLSTKFKVTNGVRQGGILYPYLFNVMYM